MVQNFVFFAGRLGTMRNKKREIFNGWRKCVIIHAAVYQHMAQSIDVRGYDLDLRNQNHEIFSSELRINM